MYVCVWRARVRHGTSVVTPSGRTTVVPGRRLDYHRIRRYTHTDRKRSAAVGRAAFNTRVTSRHHHRDSRVEKGLTLPTYDKGFSLIIIIIIIIVVVVLTACCFGVLGH